MINVYTPNFERVGTITDFESSIMSNSFYSKGDFEIYIDKSKKYTDYLVKDNIIQFGNSPTDVGIITHRSIFRDELGRTGNTLFIKGFTLDQLLYNRHIIPPIGKNYMSFEGNQEYIMKQFVYHNLINAEDKDRNIPLKLSEDKGLGKSDKWRARYDNLGEFINKIANYSNLGWEVSLDIKNKCFIFDVKKGVNRQNNNKVRPPIIFQVSFGNVFSREFIEDSTNSKNVLYGGGSGANENKIFQKVGNSKGLYRVEGYREFTGVDNPIELRKELENATKELQPVKTFNVEVAPDKPFKFGEDYFLGDYVTVVDKELDVKLNAQITKVTKYDQGLSGIDITFGKDILSFSSSAGYGTGSLVDIPSTEDIPEPTPGKPGKDGKDGKDGISLEYNWNNTKLGIKREDELYFSYVDLKGDKGDKGDKGEKGEKGDPGSDAKVTKANIESALGFSPANKTDIQNYIHLEKDIKEEHVVSNFNNGLTISAVPNSSYFPSINKLGVVLTFINKLYGGYAQTFITSNGDTWSRRTNSLTGWGPWYSNKENIDKKANQVDIPTLISQLENDEGFITKDDIKDLDIEKSEDKVFLDDSVTESNGPNSFSEGVTISNNGSNRFPTIGEWGMAITFKPSGLRATQLYITKDGELWGRRGSTANSWASWYSVKNEIDKKADKTEVVTSVNGKKGDVTISGGNTKITTSKSVSSSSWYKSGDYYRARISDSSVTSRSIVDVNIHLSDLEKASDLLPVTQSYSGYFYLYANSKPSSTIWFDYKVVKE